MDNRILIILIFVILFVCTGNAQNHQEKVLIDQTTAKEIKLLKHKDIQTKIDALYENLKDYKTADTKFFDESIGGVIHNRCMIIFGSFLFIFILVKVLPVVYNPNNKITVDIFIKPFLLLMFISFYSTIINLVEIPINFIKLKDYTSQNIELVHKTKKVVKKYSHRRNSINPIGGTYEGYETTIDKEVVDTMSRGEFIKKLSELDKNIASVYKKDSDEIGWLTEQIKSVFLWLGGIITIIMRIVQMSILSVLYIGGPIAILFELLPPFKGSLLKWFGIFIHTHMWTPVIFIIDLITYKVQHYFTYTNEEFGGIIIVTIQLAVFALYFMIAKLASYFIKSQEGGGALAAMKYQVMRTAMRMGGSSIVKKFGGGAGSVLGKASGAVSGSVKGIMK